MSPVGWEALGQWGEDVARIEPLAGGVANDMWSVRVHGHLAVGRLGARSDADLAWETELSTDLLHAETGTKIDLGAMPPEGVARCRAAWARLIGRQTCVVHGDPNPRSIRMTADRVALIDWDEAHVDVPDLDLVLPHNAAGLDDGAHDIAAQASAAWEAAVCWDDEHAIKRLAEVQAV
jgi:aminoglycoside phosphotransferase (APT) family kinase protein